MVGYASHRNLRRPCPQVLQRNHPSTRSAPHVRTGGAQQRVAKGGVSIGWPAGMLQEDCLSTRRIGGTSRAGLANGAPRMFHRLAARRARFGGLSKMPVLSITTPKRPAAFSATSSLSAMQRPFTARARRQFWLIHSCCHDRRATRRSISRLRPRNLARSMQS